MKVLASGMKNPGCLGGIQIDYNFEICLEIYSYFLSIGSLKFTRYRCISDGNSLSKRFNDGNKVMVG